MSGPDEPRAPTGIVRAATPGDLQEMARVHVDTWKTTYRGIVPDRYLDELTYESDIARGFGRWLWESPTPWRAFVAVASGEEIVGFANGGPGRERDPDFAGELGAIYVRKAHQAHGVGRALVREVTRYLIGAGTTSMIVWVLEANPYRRFYERLGGTAARRRVAPVAGTQLQEIGYGWKDITQLSR